MKRKPIIFATLMLLLFINDSRLLAQQMTTMGTDFWVTSIGEVSTGGNDFSSIQLLFAAPRACNATISNPITGWDTTISLEADSGKYLPLYYYARSTLSGTEYDYGFHITTTDTVSLYAFDGNGSNCELSNILPTPVLGNYYIIQTYPTLHLGYWGNRSFAIITTEDSTFVQITLNGATNSGNQIGETINKLLPTAGTCYQINSDYYGDWSGTQVFSNKKIAVFQGNHQSSVPVIDYYSTSANHQFVEQAIPANQWGRHFIVPHSGYNSADKVRITSKDGCYVYRNGQFYTTIVGRGTHEYTLDSSSLADYITTSSAASISLYNTTHYDTTIYGNLFCTRRSSSTTIHPLKNATKYISFYFNNEPYHVTIVTHTSDTNLIFFDTLNIGHLFTPIENNNSFSIARLQNISNDYHTITAHGGSGFNAYYTNPTHWVKSCPLGAGFPTTQNSLTIINITDATLLDTTNKCTNQTIAMSIVSDHETDSILWLFGDGTQQHGINAEHTYSQAGTYTITAIIYASCQECINAVDTLQTIARILPNSTIILDTLVYGCDSLIFDGNIYYTNDTLNLNNATNIWGCDSTIRIPLHVYHSYTQIDKTTIYDTSTFTWIDGNTYTESTDEPIAVLQAQNGCDSTIHLHLIVLPTPEPQHIDSASIWVPTAFTPGEETNQRFRIFSHDIIEAKVSIFNRQGVHIVTFDGLADSWDGTYKGHSCPQDSYVYLVEYTSRTSPRYKQHKTGTITLIR